MNDNRIDVTLPLKSEFAATIRVLAASLGADAGFSIDEIDDLRLGISEVFAVFVDEHAGGRAEASFTSAPGELSVTMRVADNTAAVELDELATNILRAVVDTVDNGEHGVTLVKRAAEGATASA